jgi:hypothetical protein
MGCMVDHFPGARNMVGNIVLLISVIRGTLSIMEMVGSRDSNKGLAH